MRNEQLIHSKKLTVILASILIFVLVIGGMLLYFRPASPWYTGTSCSDYSGAIYDPASPWDINELVDETPGIVVATVLNPKAYAAMTESDGAAPQLHITEVIKGSKVLHADDELLMCPGTGMVEFDDGNHTVLVFLEGKNSKYWVPERGYIGVIPQKKNGHFKTDMFEDSPNSFTTEDIRSLVE